MPQAARKPESVTVAITVCGFVQRISLPKPNLYHI
jgi:hypothetical protein